MHGSIWPQQLTAQLIERNPPCDQRGGPGEIGGRGGGLSTLAGLLEQSNWIRMIALDTFSLANYSAFTSCQFCQNFLSLVPERWHIGRGGGG